MPDRCERQQRHSVVTAYFGGRPASDISPELDTNPSGVYLRGIRLHGEMTQEGLAKLTGIPRANISTMEHGKRPIGRETAKKLATVLHCDYRRFR
jgi:DNA-binding XRE family transcriptional regulator